MASTSNRYSTVVESTPTVFANAWLAKTYILAVDGLEFVINQEQLDGLAQRIYLYKSPADQV